MRVRDGSSPASEEVLGVGDDRKCRHQIRPVSRSDTMSPGVSPCLDRILLLETSEPATSFSIQQCWPSQPPP